MNAELLPKQDFNELNDEVLSKVKQLRRLNIEIEYIRDDFWNQQTNLRDRVLEFNQLSCQVTILIEEIHRILPNFDSQCKLEDVKQMHQKQINRNQKLIQELLKRGFKSEAPTLTTEDNKIQGMALDESSYSIFNNLKEDRYKSQIPEQLTNNEQHNLYTLGRNDQQEIEDEVQQTEEERTFMRKVVGVCGILMMIAGFYTAITGEG